MYSTAASAVLFLLAAGGYGWSWGPSSRPEDDGGGGRAGPVRVENKRQAKGRLLRAIEDLTENCVDGIETTRSELRASARELRFFDGRPSEGGSANIQQLLGSIYGLEPGVTFNSVTFGESATTLFYKERGISNVVVLGAQFFHHSTSIARQGAVLVHELLHYHLQMGDAKMARAYIENKKWGENEASVRITEWLEGGCR